MLERAARRRLTVKPVRRGAPLDRNEWGAPVAPGGIDMHTIDQTVLLLNCTLKRSPEESSCQLMAEQLREAFAA